MLFMVVRYVVDLYENDTCGRFKICHQGSLDKPVNSQPKTCQDWMMRDIEDDSTSFANLNKVTEMFLLSNLVTKDGGWHVLCLSRVSTWYKICQLLMDGCKKSCTQK